MTERLFGKKIALAGVFKASLLAFVAILAIGIYDFVLPIFTEGESDSFALAGIIVSLVYVASLLSEIPVGKAVDRYGRIKVLIAAVLCMGTVGVAYFFIKSLLLLAVLSVLTGVAAVAFWIPSAVLVRDFSPRKMLGQSQGVYLTISQIGWVIGPMLAGTISILFSDRHNFLLYAGFMFLAAGVASLLFRGEKAEKFRKLEEGHKHQARLSMIFHSLAQYLKLHKHALPVYALSFIAYVWIALEWSFIALAGMDTFGFNEQMAGMVVSMMMAIEGLLYYSSGWMMDRVGHKYILTSGFMVLFASSYFIFLAPTAEIFILAALIAAGATSWILPGTEAIVTKIVPANIMGEMTSVFDTSKDLGLIFGPLVGGILATVLSNPQVPFLIVAVFAGIGCLFCGYVFWPEKKRKK